MIIVIDGPAGAGKSSTAKEVARHTGFDYVDSGAIYRGFTYLYVICDYESSRFLNVLDDHGLDFDFKGLDARVYYKNRDVTREIRSKTVNDCVSKVATLQEVRDQVRNVLRQRSGHGSVVLEGRDLGSVVFPDADLKIFLTADQAARAQRRYAEELEKGRDVTFEEVLQNVRERDRVDSTRTIDPLKKADDAIVIDSTSLSFDEQVRKILEIVGQNKANSEKQTN